MIFQLKNYKMIKNNFQIFEILMNFVNIWTLNNCNLTKACARSRYVSIFYLLFSTKKSEIILIIEFIFDFSTFYFHLSHGFQ